MRSVISKKPRGWKSQVVRRFWDNVGAHTPVKAVERTCDELRLRLGSEDPPFRASDYAQLVNARIFEDDLPDKCQGSLSFFAGRFVIHIPSSAPREESNFTICHEIGHIEMLRRAGYQPPFSLLSPEAASRLRDFIGEEERLANAFAMNLLMPRKIFSTAAKSLPPNLASIAELTTRFEASVDDVARRIVELSLWPCMLIWCRPIQSVTGRSASQVLDFAVSRRFAHPPHDYLRRGMYADWLFPASFDALENRAVAADPIISRLRITFGNSPSCVYHIQCARTTRGSVVAFITT